MIQHARDPDLVADVFRVVLQTLSGFKGRGDREATVGQAVRVVDYCGLKVSKTHINLVG